MSESLWRLLKVERGAVVARQQWTALMALCPPCHHMTAELYGSGPRSRLPNSPRHHLVHLVAFTMTLLLFHSREPPCQSSQKKKKKKNPNRWSRAGNRRHANHGSFDRRSYLIIQPSGRPGRHWAARAAYCTICVSNCYDIELRVASERREVGRCFSEVRHRVNVKC